MAQDRVLGEQIDLVDLTADIAADETAIGNIATGITNDPGASAALDLDYVRRDGTTAMSGTLTVNSNIVVTGTVDGRDVALDGSTQDTHIGDTSLHFVVGDINHQSITGAGTNTHSSIDTHIGDATLHFTEASIDHASIQNVGSNTHTAIDAHITDATKHRLINDAGTTTTELFSASKIIADFSTASHSHNIEDLNNVVVTGSPAAVTNEILRFNGANWVNSSDTGMLSLIEDTSPQLGGNLDVNGHSIITPYSTTNTSPSITIAVGVTAYAGHYATAGDVNISSGTSYDNNSAGNVNISGGKSYGVGGFILSNGGSVNIYAGESLTSNYGLGGDVNIVAGDANGGNNTGGNVKLFAGGTSSANNSRGGELEIRSGSSTLDTAGALSIVAGTTGGDNFAPKVTIAGSSSNGTQPAGDIRILAGGNSSTGDGGEIFIAAGNSTAGVGGDLLLVPGGGTGSTSGTINLHTGGNLIGTAELRLWNDTNTVHSTGNYVVLKAPATVNNRTWTLPQDDPTTANGQFLTTNASGVLSFAVVNTNLVADLTPQLGGDLDTNNFNIITTHATSTGSPSTSQYSNSIAIKTGNVNTSGYTYSKAGNIEIAAGAGETGNQSYGGYLLLRGGNSNTTAGSGNANPGDVFIYGGQQEYANGGEYGGSFRFIAGDGLNSNYGGYVRIESGFGVAHGGNFWLEAGNGNPGGGGDMRISAGSGDVGGQLSLWGGASNNAAKPTACILSASSQSGTSDGGDMEIRAGRAPNGYIGGDIKLIPGNQTGVSDNTGAGAVQIHAARTNTGEASIQIWSDTDTGHTTGNYVELKAPAFVGSPPVNRTWVLPQDDPAVVSGEFLTTDASGNLSFGAPAVANITIDNFADTVDYTSGTTTQLTLSIDPATENNISVVFDGVVQHHDQYSISTTTLTFSAAIPLGTNNVEVIIGTSPIVGTPADGTVTNAKFASDVVTSHGGRITSAGATTVASAGLVITKPGTGSYLVTHNWGHVNYAPTATVDGTAVYVTIGVVGINTFEVKTYTDGTTTAVDAGFTFNVAEW